MVTLTPPVQRGWVRYFVLRDDVARSRNAAFYEGILAKINTRVYCSRKDFMKKKRRGSKHRRVTEQYVLSPDEWQFQRLQFTEKEKVLFEERISLCNDLSYRKTHVFIEAWRFVLVVKPKMITAVKLIDPLLEASIREIRNRLDRQHLWGAYYKARGKRRDSWKNRYPNFKEKYEYQNTPLHAILGMIEADACTEQNETT